MLLDLNRLHGPREHVERTFQPSAFDPQDEDYRVAAPVALSMDVEKAGGDAFTVTGQLTGRLEMMCSRCLEPFDVPVAGTFDLRYVPHTDNTGEGEREIEEDDLTTAFYRDGQLDIGDLMREQFLLVLPMKPLCTDGCSGLCPRCGANLNRTQCGCTPVWEDPRLETLKGLMNRQKEQ